MEVNPMGKTGQTGTAKRKQRKFSEW